MAKCALCGKSGLFLKVDNEGYCKSCAEFMEKHREEERQRKETEQMKKQSERNKISSIPLCPINVSLCGEEQAAILKAETDS